MAQGEVTIFKAAVSKNRNTRVLRVAGRGNVMHDGTLYQDALVQGAWPVSKSSIVLGRNLIVWGFTELEYNWLGRADVELLKEALINRRALVNIEAEIIDGMLYFTFGEGGSFMYAINDLPEPPAPDFILPEEREARIAELVRLAGQPRRGERESSEDDDDDDQGDDDPFEVKVSFKHPGTSFGAARSMSFAGVKSQRQDVMRILAEHSSGLTDDEGYRESPYNRDVWRTRRSDLCDMGLVYDSGKKRITEAGRKRIENDQEPTDAIVWMPMFDTGKYSPDVDGLRTSHLLARRHDARKSALDNLDKKLLDRVQELRESMIYPARSDVADA